MLTDVGGTKGVSRVQPVKDGALLTFEIRSWANDPSKERLDRGHKGPCAVYLKKVDSAVNDKAIGDGWFKLFDHGYDASTERWCTDEIIDNNGLLSVHLPKGLEGGYYLARPEILALHAANSGNPQFYTGCAQIFVKSTGNLVPESTVSIPGYVKYGQPATSFDIYNTDNAKYTLPGPAVAKLTPRGAQTGSDSQTSQTEGVKPAGCLVENSNWCGEEVSSYTTEKGCWASSAECWAQSKKCYAASLPTGDAGCDLWQTKCTGIQAQCNAGNFNGPPNKGKVLTPKKNPINVGQIMATVGGGIVYAAKTNAVEQEVQTGTPAKTTSAAAYTPTPAPAKTTSAAAAAPKPSSVDNDDDNEDDAEYDTDKPVYTLTVSSSSANAPAPTQAPEACPKGWKCVTVTELAVVTQTVYVTAAYDGGYKKRSVVHRRRWAHRA